MELFGILDKRIDQLFSWDRYFPNTPNLSLYNQIGTKNPIYVDCSWGRLWDVYSGIPHLALVINKCGELLSMGKVRLFEADEKKEILKHSVLDLFASPNPLQSKAEFFTQYVVFKYLYGINFFYKLQGIPGLMDVPDGLWNLPPSAMKIIPTGKMFDQHELKGIIKQYEMRYQGRDVVYETNQILCKSDNLSTNYLEGNSKIKSLVKPLSNIDAALQTSNVLMVDHGAYGILSNQGNKDAAGILPLGDDERKAIEDRLNQKYGNRDMQNRVIVTNASMSFTPMTFSMKDMMLMEEIEQDFGIICGAFGVDRDVFPSIKGATNENKRAGMIATIQDAVMPEADDLMEDFTKEFKLDKQGLKLKMTFDHLPIMRDVKLKEQEGINKQKEGARTGSEAIVNLNAAVSGGEMDRTSAINVLIHEFKYEKPVAESMVTQLIAGANIDSLGKIPLALQQLALARERANTAGDVKLSEALASAMDKLTEQLVATVLSS